MRAARTLVTVLIPMLLPALGPMAGERCTGEIDTGLTKRRISYDPLAVTDTFVDTEVRIRNLGAGECRFRLAFYRDPASDAKLGGLLPYRLEARGRSALLDDWPARAAPSVFLDTRKLASGESGRIPFSWRIARAQMVPPGVYRDTVRLRLYEIGGNDLLDDRDLTFEVLVPTVLQANLAGAGVASPFSYTMDFGTLERGERRRVTIDVSTNTNYRITVSSENRGALKGPPRRSSGSWSVAYEAALDGRRLDLSAGADRLGKPFPSNGRARHSFTITIGEVAGRRAGTYSDVITIELTPVP